MAKVDTSSYTPVSEMMYIVQMFKAFMVQIMAMYETAIWWQKGILLTIVSLTSMVPVNFMVELLLNILNGVWEVVLNKSIIPEDKYVWVGLFMLILGNTFWGLRKHLKQGTYDKKTFLRKTTIDSFIALSAMFLLQTFASIYSGEPFIYTWTLMFFRTMVYWIVLMPLCNSWYVVSNGRFPPKFFMKLMLLYKETGDPSIFHKITTVDMMENGGMKIEEMREILKEHEQNLMKKGNSTKIIPPPSEE